MIAVNLTGAFLTLREGAEGDERAGWGRLVVVASVAGLKGYPYVAPYCAAKHGAVGLVRALAAEIAGSGDHRERGLPGLHESPMLEERDEHRGEDRARSEREARGRSCRK